MESQTRSERGAGKKNLTPNWKRPLTCAIFLPGSSAKNKTVQTLGRGGRALEFSVCRNDPKEKGRHSPRSPGRPKEPAAPPLPWAGESPRPALRAPLLRGRATPQLCARKQPAARAPAPPPGPPPPPPAPLLESEGGAPLGQPATPGKGLASPAELDQPRSRGNRRSEPPPALAAASLARVPTAPGPATLFRERSVPRGSPVGPAPAWEATAGRAPRTWRLGSPDRLPGQSALALSALPDRSRWPGAVLGAGIRNQSCVLRAGSWNRLCAHALCPLFKLSKNVCHAPLNRQGLSWVPFIFFF